MDWFPIRDCGYALVQNALSGKPATKEWLVNTMTEFAKISTRFYDVLEEFPFNYGEKQIGSVLTPALLNTSDAVFQEQPAIRK